MNEKNDNRDRLEFISTIITTPKGNVLLLKRSKELKLDPNKYDMCSGHMKIGEAPMQTVYREIKEELKIDLVDIQYVELLGTINTPHEKLENTKTHIYNVGIDLSIEEINERIRSILDGEIEEALYLENINELRKLQNNTSLFRTKYKEETERMYQILEERMHSRKEKGKEECEEK